MLRLMRLCENGGGCALLGSQVTRDGPQAELGQGLTLCAASSTQTVDQEVIVSYVGDGKEC